MKKFLSIFLCILLLACCFTGCKETVEENCVKYTLVRMGPEEMQQTAAQVKEATGLSDLYLKLYDDGTAQMRVSKEIIALEYGDDLIWRPEDPNTVYALVILGDTVTIIDNFYIYEFAK